MHFHVYFSSQAGIFQEFIVQEESVTFRINLTVLLDCLSIFGSSPMPGEPFYYHNDKKQMLRKIQERLLEVRNISWNSFLTGYNHGF